MCRSDMLMDNFKFMNEVAVSNQSSYSAKNICRSTVVLLAPTIAITGLGAFDIFKENRSTLSAGLLEDHHNMPK